MNACNMGTRREWLIVLTCEKVSKIAWGLYWPSLSIYGHSNTAKNFKSNKTPDFLLGAKRKFNGRKRDLCTRDLGLLLQTT